MIFYVIFRDTKPVTSKQRDKTLLSVLELLHPTRNGDKEKGLLVHYQYLEPERQKNFTRAPHTPVSLQSSSASLLLVSSLALELSSLSILIMTLDFSVEIIFSPTFNVVLCQYLVFFGKILHLQFVNLNSISKVEGKILLDRDTHLSPSMYFITNPDLLIKLNNKCVY